MTDRMKSEPAYMFAEIKHMLALNESPWQIAHALNRKPGTIYQSALRHGETHIAEVFNDELQFVAKSGWQESVARKTRRRKLGNAA